MNKLQLEIFWRFADLLCWYKGSIIHAAEKFNKTYYRWARAEASRSARIEELKDKSRVFEIQKKVDNSRPEITNPQDNPEHRQGTKSIQKQPRTRFNTLTLSPSTDKFLKLKGPAWRQQSYTSG